MSETGYFKARRERAKAEGLCSRCLAPADATLCDPCREQRAKASKKAVAARRCSKCRRPSGFEEHCPICRDRAASKGDLGLSRGRWYFTDHAIEQFIERHGARTGARTRALALAWMRTDSTVARHIHNNAETGDAVWAGARPWNVRYVIGELPEHLLANPDAKPPVVTVLPARRRS